MSFVDDILKNANIPGGETYWEEQPRETYAAWGDTIDADGSDFRKEILHHDVEIELYELMDQPDPGAHKRLKASLSANGLHWQKAPRMIDLKLRLYMTRYTFSYSEKVAYDLYKED